PRPPRTPAKSRPPPPGPGHTRFADPPSTAGHAPRSVTASPPARPTVSQRGSLSWQASDARSEPGEHPDTGERTRKRAPGDARSEPGEHPDTGERTRKRAPGDARSEPGEHPDTGERTRKRALGDARSE